jgi:hypothetical protein
VSKNIINNHKYNYSKLYKSYIENILIANLTIGSFMKETSISDDDIQAIYKTIGKNVKRIRKDQDVTQLALALAIGHKAVGTVSMAELCLNGKHFNIEHLYKIADVLDVDVCEFFKGT